MAEQSISKRVSFPKGKQQRFLDRVLEKVSVKEIAELCGLSERTIRDWRREKFLMDSDALNALCKKLNISIPADIELRERYWYGLKGASVGGRAVIAKYGHVGGDPEYRKKKWHEWWEREGKHKTGWANISKPRTIQKPIYSQKLAEFVGIILGDGGISRYQVIVTLHSIDDKEFGIFVTKLIEALFRVPVGIHINKRDAAVDYVVSRIELVRF